MSQALKCDRCGVCFDPLSGKNEEFIWFYNPHFHSGNSIREHKKTRLWNDHGSDEDKIDLCPSCTRAFEKFMKCDEVFTVKTDILRSSCESQLWNSVVKIYVDTREQAENILRRLNQDIEQYADVSVVDVYAMVGLDCPHGYQDLRYGWRDLFNVYILPEEDRWVLLFPCPVWLDVDDTENEAEKYLNGGDTDGDELLPENWQLGIRKSGDTDELGRDSRDDWWKRSERKGHDRGAEKNQRS